MTSLLQTALPAPAPTDRSLQVIVCAVIALHLLLVGWLAFFDSSAPPKRSMPSARRFVVQTVELNPSPAPARAAVPAAVPVPEAERSVVEVSPPKAEEAPKPKAPPAPKTPEKPAPPKTATAKPEAKPVEKAKQPPAKQEAKPVQQPKAAPKPAPKAASPVREAPKKNPVEEKGRQQELEQQKQKELAKKQERERQAKLLAQAEERIAKIGAGHGKVNPGKEVKAVAVVPGAITSLHVDTLPSETGGVQLSFKEAAYRDELAARLKLQLRLPERGDVRVKLTLERSGKVVKAVVEGSQSDVNRKYIEKALPGIAFPPFGSNFGTDPEYTFSITLSNE